MDDNKYLVPHIISPLQLQFKDPTIPEDINIRLQGDIKNNFLHMYISRGKENPNYTKSIPLSTINAIALAKHILTKANETQTNYNILQKEEEFINNLKLFLNENIVTSIIIYPKRVYTSDISNFLFGSIIMNVNYTTINENEYNMDIVSEVYFTTDISKYDNLSTELHSKYSNLKEVIFDNENFKKIIEYIGTLIDVQYKELNKIVGGMIYNGNEI